VIDANIEGLPEVLGDGILPPAPPDPTVIGYVVAAQTTTHPVLKPPPPPPPPFALPPPPPPATTKNCVTRVPGCVVNVVDPVADVTVHFPNDVGLITPTIPPLGDPISHYSCLKIF
jgi:hypothetical protein